MNLPKQLCAVRVYSFTSCLRLTDAVWVALLAARGFTLAQIGLAEAVFHLTSLLCEVPSGVAADLLGRRLNLAVSAVFEIFSDVTMAFSPNLAAVCAAMALKALAYTMISGTLEALTYDSLKTAGRENEYLQADAKSRFCKSWPQRWGRWQVYSPTCCNLPGFTWPMQRSAFARCWRR